MGFNSGFKGLKYSFMVLFGKNMEPSNRLPALASLLFGMLFLNFEAWNFISESNFPSMASSPSLSPLPLRCTEGHCFALRFTVFADKSDIKMWVQSTCGTIIPTRAGKNRSSRRETSPSATTSTANLARSNLVLRGERLATVRLSRGTACTCACCGFLPHREHIPCARCCLGK